ncbi:hypothetical protein GFC01_04375 [Desulfofundulus thermobenzoicus]|uniref:Uncharacterized protein n=1 Tax=Desulfofundulus thermobenzoicus TaxID=29376 RepID=A0A6N7IND9_9FIRM|nr:hypothetical protein [Desulfofundulus thermobenzoicus]MQL51512.1 hypothetical protein [Desulfofundulus thermobenzoicus]
MLVPFLLALFAVWLSIMLVRVFSLVGLHRNTAGQPRGKLVVLLGNQDGAAEGFLRRLAAGCLARVPPLDLSVIVADWGRDLTGPIAGKLGRRMGFQALPAEEADGENRVVLNAALSRLPGEPRHGMMVLSAARSGPAGSERGKGIIPAWYYDARGLQGRELLKAPVLRPAPARNYSAYDMWFHA